MCGLLTIWNRDSVFDFNTIHTLFSWASKRGNDGYGLCIYNIHEKAFHVVKSVEPYSALSFKEPFKNLFIDHNLWTKDSILIGLCRANPETEVETSIVNMQPITYKDCVLIHNGSISNEIVSEYINDETKSTDIDSEVILHMYHDHFNKDIKRVAETLVGGFGFIMIDSALNRMYIVSNFKPLSFGYIRGKGMLVASDLYAIKEVIESVTSCKSTGICVWEDFYYEPLPVFFIREIDLESGFMRTYDFKPRYEHPQYKGFYKHSIEAERLNMLCDVNITDNNNKVIKNTNNNNNNDDCVIVSASGGIDSGLTSWILGALGYKVLLVHFNYGHKGEEVEAHAIKLLVDRAKTKGYDLSYKYYDLSHIFKEDPSSLIQPHIEIETAVEGKLKTTTAWVSGRNLVFLSVLSSLAEQLILSNTSDSVYIASGMSQLSESGFYPDNSEKFIDSFFETIKTGTITPTKIFNLPVLRNIMKYEEWILGNALHFPFECTVSCDYPKLDPSTGDIMLCNQCGSTLLSKWASMMAQVPDPRKFYDRTLMNMGVDVKFEETKYSSNGTNNQKLTEVDKIQKLLSIIRRLYLPNTNDSKKLETMVIS